MNYIDKYAALDFVLKNLETLEQTKWRQPFFREWFFQNDFQYPGAEEFEVASIAIDICKCLNYF